jgi:hypothetical protein
VGVIDAPAPLVSNRPLTFDARRSHDPDPGDRVAGYSWEVAVAGAVPAGCEPLAGGAGSADFTVLFPCGGEFEVSLVVADELGLESAPTLLRLQVAQSPEPPLVTVGPDLAVDHRCTGLPLRCTSWDGSSSAFALSAEASGPPGVAFQYRWAASPPPELAGLPAPRAVFSPGPDHPSPAVVVETDGTAIAGVWSFRVEATDSRGMVAVGRQQVSVGNRAPVLVGGGMVELPHAYDRAAGIFRASGTTTPASWSDPDGDPVVSLGFSFVHEGDGGSAFQGEDLGDRARVDVAVPYVRPSDAALLIGPGVRRRVDLAVADANGARTATSWTIAVGNRPPRVRTPVTSASADHSFDVAGGRYLARAPLSTWVDDDGDPLFPAVSGSAACGEVSEVLGTAWVTCSTPYSGVPGVQAIARRHDLAIAMRDPWDAAPAQVTSLEVRNRRPRLLATTAGIPAACAPSTRCCEPSGTGSCLEHDVTWGPGEGAVPLVVDDDGDPLDLSLSADAPLGAWAPPQPCPASGCAVGLGLPGGASHCGAFAPAGTLAVLASDGLASASGTVAIASDCR